MQINRIGLPRRYLQWLVKQLLCPRGCQHAVDDASCNRWRWTVLHKDVWELHVWSDGRKVVCALTSCCSGTRVTSVVRQVGRRTYEAECPEAIGLYGIFGRGGTDGGDQERVRLGLARRRRLRQGTKGALFDFEIGLVDGVAGVRLKRAERQTVFDFALEFSNEVLDGVTTRRRGGSMAAELAAQKATRAQGRAHVPECFSEELKRSKRSGESASEARARRGHECCNSPNCGAGEPDRPHYYCDGCRREREGCNGWYHWKCFWEHHSAVAI